MIATKPGEAEIVTAAFDLDKYLARIGYTGERTPVLDTLKAIHLRHAESIPFENLNPLLGWPVLLDAPSLQRKLIRDGRGGWCFEHNLLLSHALEALRFRVTGLAARVLWNAPDGAIPPRGHMLLRIDLDGASYIVDAGFGGMTLTGPLRLEPDVEQATPHEPFRLISVDGQLLMQAKLNGSWKALYRFGLEQQLLPDYEVTNWYLAHHPDSHFLKGLIAARPAAGRRYALRDNELSVHHLDGRTERRTLNTTAEVRRVLEDELRLTVPDAPEVEAVLRRAASPHKK